MDRERILINVGNISAEDLFESILNGVVTLRDLMETGDLDTAKRKKIQELQEENEAKDDELWEKVEFGNEEGLRDYISTFPNGKHTEDAKFNIRSIVERQKAEVAEAEMAKRRILNDPNTTPVMVKQALESGIVSRQDLVEIGISNIIIDKIYNYHEPQLILGEDPDQIPNGFTEVYFWGVPGCGKTTALAAILSAAERSGYLEIKPGPGYDYMTRIKNIFNQDIAFLPNSTPEKDSQYLPFVLNRGRDKPRSISLIELSGEIFKCFYKKYANLPLTDEQEKTFSSVKKFLSSSNRKIHFFFIDYKQFNSTDEYGYTQSDYLSAASTFFNDEDVFKKTTDGIYIVLAKSDLMPGEVSDRVQNAKEYLRQNNFSAFVNTLKKTCNQHSINAGKLTVEPFSLGSVHFKKICEFESESANRIVDLLVSKVKPNRKSIFDFLNN